MKKLKVKLREIILLVIFAKDKNLNSGAAGHSLCSTTMLPPMDYSFSTKARYCVLSSISWKEYFTQGPSRRKLKTKLGFKFNPLLQGCAISITQSCFGRVL